MATVISLLRGVNVGGHRNLKMDVLREVYESLGFEDVRTYVQSGNVVFRTKGNKLMGLASRIEYAIENAFGFRPDVILRSCEEMKAVLGRNPFEGREGVEPNKLQVMFLAGEPCEDGVTKILGMKTDPEEVRVCGRELYIYFPHGMGKTKLPLVAMGKALKTPGTCRNWNTVVKLVEMAEGQA